jgi:cytochrome P450
VVETGPPGGVAWLRAGVARFSSGEDHRRRRARVVADLDRIALATLRRQAHDRTAALLAAAGGAPVDLMTQVARAVPVGVLGDALGVEVPVAAVTAVARAYQPGTPVTAGADRAVASLVDVFGGAADETSAARIGLLVQACDATAGLIGNAMAAIATWSVEAPVNALLVETLRHDPPVRVTRRLATAPVRVGAVQLVAGEVVHLDLAAANRDPAVFADPDRFDPHRPGAHEHLTFGAGGRPCPGGNHATTIAAGVLGAARRCRLVEATIGYEPSATLRVPVRLLVRAA